MSWFNASHLSSFAKQALTTAQKSIDRVLDIKEEDRWGDTTEQTFTGKFSYKLVHLMWKEDQRDWQCRVTSSVTVTGLQHNISDIIMHFYSCPQTYTHIHIFSWPHFRDSYSISQLTRKPHTTKKKTESQTKANKKIFILQNMDQCANYQILSLYCNHYSRKLYIA